MYLTRRFYILSFSIAFILALGYLNDFFFIVGQRLVELLFFASLLEILLLYIEKKGISAHRHMAERFSNGDDNQVRIDITSNYKYPLALDIVDEIPVIFENRNVSFKLKLKTLGSKVVEYLIQPTQRGEYGFGLIRIFVSVSFLGLVQRRYSLGEPSNVKVYPSFLMLNKYELMAMSDNLTEIGIKKIRKIGNNTEFEQIKDYVPNDDFRTINWKASARRNHLMVNVYQDEKSQQIISVIDKGRVMQHTFCGMTLLDYAINASLVISYIAIKRDDKAGLITFERNFDTFVSPSKQSSQLPKLLDALYNQETSFDESDYSALCVYTSKFVNKRSLLIVYTNFDSVVGMQRQLAYLRQLALHHVVLVVFFEDVELSEYIKQVPKRTEDYFTQAIAEKFSYEKRLIVTKLRQNGVYSLLTTPKGLSVDLINKYLEMKARHII